MGRTKLARFEYNANSANVIEPGKEVFTNIKGNWRSFFGNEQPITLELGCGRGEYTTGLAKVFPQRNYIGVDVKGARIWKGSSVANENQLKNAAFLRAPILLIKDFFEKGEVDEIWITFPDPKPRDRDEKNRLSGPVFLSNYKEILSEGGIVHLKTDNKPLYDFTLENLLLADKGNTCFPYYISELTYTDDLYNSPLLEEHYGIETTYERKFRESVGNKINYLRFRLYTA
ncbi:MAG: tRNA (guanosine(46)-N7)-methyltransferase TrmB [Cytophagaceae bacterium]